MWFDRGWYIGRHQYRLTSSRLQAWQVDLVKKIYEIHGSTTQSQYENAKISERKCYHILVLFVTSTLNVADMLWWLQFPTWIFVYLCSDLYNLNSISYPCHPHERTLRAFPRLANSKNSKMVLKFIVPKSVGSILIGPGGVTCSRQLTVVSKSHRSPGW